MRGDMRMDVQEDFVKFRELTCRGQRGKPSGQENGVFSYA